MKSAVNVKSICVTVLSIFISFLVVFTYMHHLNNKDINIEKRFTDIYNDTFVVGTEVYGMLGLIYRNGYFMSHPENQARLEYSQDDMAYRNYVWVEKPYESYPSAEVTSIVNQTFNCIGTALYLQSSGFYMRIPNSSKIDVEINRIKKEKNYATISGLIYVADTDKESLEENMNQLYKDLQENKFLFSLSICGKVIDSDGKEQKYIARIVHLTTFTALKPIDITYF